MLNRTRKLNCSNEKCSMFGKRVERSDNFSCNECGKALSRPISIRERKLEQAKKELAELESCPS